MDKLFTQLYAAATTIHRGHDEFDQTRKRLQAMNEISGLYFEQHVHDDLLAKDIKQVVCQLNDAWDLVRAKLLANGLTCSYRPGYYLNSLLTYAHPNPFRNLFA